MRFYKPVFCILCLIVCVRYAVATVAASSATTLATDSQAQAFIETLGKKTIHALAQNAQSVSAPKERFYTILRDFFDVEDIARFVLGRFARQATPAEWARYFALFEERLVHLYAMRFENYQRESFVVKNVQSIQDEERSGWLVGSQVLRTNGHPIAVDWIVFPTPRGLKVFDVQIGGFSLKLQQRDDYAAVIQKNGGTVSGLIEFLGGANKKF